MIFAQDGFQPSDKIQSAFTDSVIDGVVLSARSRSEEKLTETIQELKTDFPHKLIFLDPEFYASTIATTRLGNLDQYSYFTPNLQRKDFKPAKVQEYTKKILDFQANLGLNYIVSPAVIIDDFSGAWSQVALQLITESCDYAAANIPASKLLLTLSINESALRNFEEMSDFLDEITTLEADGFYIVVERLTANNPLWSEPDTLARLMHLVNALKANDYFVAIGCIDIVGLMLVGAGADVISHGWWKNSRQFTRDRYMDGKGRTPKATYTSAQLLNSIYIDPDLQAIVEQGAGGLVITGTKYDSILADDPINKPWEAGKATLHYWSVMKKLDSEIRAPAELDDRLAIIKNKIDAAQAVYAQLRGQGLGFESTTGPLHLRVWDEAITLLKRGLI